jgi:uncharacterized membrane protein
MAAQHVERDYGIDALRGLAIVAMVASHLAREVLSPPHPLWLRVFGSLAAPLFITLAGMLAAQTGANKRHPPGYYLQRGGAILALAALIDVLLWGIYPFVGCDVLYLIGVAVPLAACFSRLSLFWQACTMTSVCLLPEVLRPLVGYPDTVFAVALNESPRQIVAGAGVIVQQWLLTGWFPLLPWLAFSFLGAWLFRWRQGAQGRFAVQAGWTALFLMAAGFAWAYLLPTRLAERAGYPELFYPPTLAFLLLAAGAVLALLAQAGAAWLKASLPLVQLGRCPVLMYVVHLVILRWLLGPLLGEVGMTVYLITYAALLLILVGAAGAVDLAKQRVAHRQLPLMLRLLLGS